MDDDILLASLVAVILMLALFGELLSSYAPTLVMSLASWP